MIQSGFFVTGTDTGIGKTTVACLLLHFFANQGYSTLGLKPIATGCHPTADGLLSEDAQNLKAMSTIQLPYQQINPITFLPPTAPNIAAGNHPLSIYQIVETCQPAIHSSAEILIVEGAGGWKVPINEKETMADLAKALHYPVIIVVGIRLGCINHALLTIESIRNDHIPIAGWVANHLEEDNPYASENINTISSQSRLTLLGEVPFNKDKAWPPARFDLALFEIPSTKT